MTNPQDGCSSSHSRRSSGGGPPPEIPKLTLMTEFLQIARYTRIKSYNARIMRERAKLVKQDSIRSCPEQRRASLQDNSSSRSSHTVEYLPLPMEGIIIRRRQQPTRKEQTAAATTRALTPTDASTVVSTNVQEKSAKEKQEWNLAETTFVKNIDFIQRQSAHTTFVRNIDYIQRQSKELIDQWMKPSS